MRQLALAAGAVCAVAGVVWQASAQVNTMPGQVVGNGYTTNVGQQVPRAAPPAGQPINLPAQSSMMRPYDPNRPYDVFKGTNLSTDQLAAPIPSLGGDQSLLGKVTERIKSVIGMGTPKTSAPPRSTYFPSLTRRNKERAQERLWRRD